MSQNMKKFFYSYYHNGERTHLGMDANVAFSTIMEMNYLGYVEKMSVVTNHHKMLSDDIKDVKQTTSKTKSFLFESFVTNNTRNFAEFLGIDYQRG